MKTELKNALLERLKKKKGFNMILVKDKFKLFYDNEKDILTEYDLNKKTNKIIEMANKTKEEKENYLNQFCK
ncbi:MAG: hypothetical protein HUJ87_14975 [Fusobacterium varium]|uniref:hypothetical protein n=1 Tax=Fusobacterium varium TaxID=856 RepID=UPI00242C305C|nr:hypothetical protein [Fusobacterium varium]MCF0171795.1 hypothetical protein [Fusobacterium varium]